MYKTTQSAFRDFKDYYDVYGTHTVKDEYNNSRLTRDTEPRTSIYTMFQPITDELTVKTYGISVKEMLSGIIYDNRDLLQEHDQLTINGTDYEIISIKKWHTHAVIIIQKLTEQT